MAKPIVSTSIRRRGIAMVLVLMVVALASVLAWGLIASTNIGPQIASARSTQIQRKYLAESGLNLAIYYLNNPDASPVTLKYGAWGNVHYPGETSISLGSMPGTLNVTVTNTACGVFEISSVGTLDGDTQTATAMVYLDKYKSFDHAANFINSIQLASPVTITGGLLTTKSLTANSANITGAILAGNPSGGGTTTLPTGTLTRFPLSITYYLPYYFADGKRYTAKRVSGATVLSTLSDSDIVNNPYNVWYADQNVSLYMTATMSGTLIVSSGKTLTIAGTWTINPKTSMPALVADGDLIVSGASRTLTVNGPTFLRGSLKGNGTTTTSKVYVNGVFASGNSGALLNGFSGTLSVAYDAQKATFKGVMDEVELVNKVTIRSWTPNNRSF